MQSREDHPERTPLPGPIDHAPGQESGTMYAHSITMLGTGLIGDFYTMTLHGQRSRDRGPAPARLTARALSLAP